MNTGLEAVAVFFGWEGNRGSGMALTSCHGLRNVAQPQEGRRALRLHSYAAWHSFLPFMLGHDLGICGMKTAETP